MTDQDRTNRSIVSRADSFAAAAHGAINQRRKYTDEPYIVHPREVASILRLHIAQHVAIAAALLHDVVEDVGAHMLPIIRDEFGDEIANLVDELTDKSKPEDGSRDVRKEIDRQRLAKASPGAQTIKLADLISNTGSIVKHDKAFAAKYLKEKRKLLEVLTKGEPSLYRLAWATLVAAEATLEADDAPDISPADKADNKVYKAIARNYLEG